MINRTRAVKDVLWITALAGFMAAVFRLWFGLGATTNLSDAVPWGLWKVLNMIGGVALSTSGFSVGFLVYVLRLKQFQPYLKPAILIAFLGYGCSCAALLFDIGLPHRFWHPIFMWNINSFLFEVFWCVMLYFTVTAIELAPVIFEKYRAERITRLLHRLAFVVVVVGISLSSLHHSSLGSLFLVTPQRLYPLWYTPWLPLLFIVSAIGGGLMVVVLAKIIWSYWYEPTSIFNMGAGQSLQLIRVIDGTPAGAFPGKPEGRDMPQIRALATIAAAILGFYFILKITDLFLHGGWGPLLAGTWESWLYIFELAITAIVPGTLLMLRRSRYSPGGISIAASSAALGLALNRLDVGIFGYFADSGRIYFPSLIEWALGFGVVAAAGLVFFFAAENLPIFGPNPPAARMAGLFRLSYGSLRQLWNTALTDGLHRVTLIAVFLVPLSFVLMYPPYFNGRISEPEVRSAIGVDAERTVLLIEGDRGGVSTIFPHVDHQKRLGDSASCVKCHHVSLPHDKSTSCSRCHRRMNVETAIFNHKYHLKAVAELKQFRGIQPENYTCVECHAKQSPKLVSGTKDCMECHKEDMFPAAKPMEVVNLRRALPFREAMHKLCIECHKSESVKRGRPHLGDCQTCHESLRAKPASSPLMAKGIDWLP